MSEERPGGEPTFYDRCIALFEHLQEVLTPERLLRDAIEGYNQTMAEFNDRQRARRDG